MSRSTSSTSDRSSQEPYPKKGKTRIPSRLVNQRAIIDLGYPFIVEGDTTVLQKALGQDNIDELLRLSEEYGRQVADSGDDQIDDEIEVVEINAGPTYATRTSSPSPSVQGGRPPAGIVPTNKFELAHFGESDRTPPGGQVFLNGVLPLNVGERPSTVVQPCSGSSDTQRAWNQPKSFMRDGSVFTELFDIHAAEYHLNHSGGHKVTLYCPIRPQSQESVLPQVRMRWLHLQGVPSELAVLEELVADCPFISQDLKLVALKVLMEVSQRCQKSSELGIEVETGAMIRFIGRRYTSCRSYQESTWDTEPVTFLSSPFLHFPGQSPAGSTGPIKTLHEYLYDYDTGSMRHEQLGAHGVTLGQETASRTLHVPSTWSLIIGSALFITFSPLPSREALGENITFDQKSQSSTHGIHTVRIIDERNQCRYHIVVDQEYNFVDFLRHAADLTQPDGIDASNCILTDEVGKIVEPASWLSLLASGDIENHIFRLRQADAKPTLDDERKLRNFSTRLLTNGSSFSEDVERALARSEPYQRQPLLLEYRVRRQNDQIAVYRPETRPGESDTEEIYGSQSLLSEHLAPKSRPDGIETIWEGFSVEEILSDDPQATWSKMNIPPARASTSSAASVTRTRERPMSGARSKSKKVNFRGDGGSDQTHQAVQGSDRMSAYTTNTTNGSVPPHVPFLTWKMDGPDQTRTKIKQDQTLVQLLNEIHRSMMSGKCRKIYLGTFQCTAQSVAKRWLPLDTNNHSSANGVNTPPPEGTEPHDSAASSGLPNPENKESDVKDMALLLSATVQTSTEIIGDFLPTTDSCSIHPLVMRLWGAVETILRQIRLAAVRSSPKEGCSWAIISEEVPELEGEMSDKSLPTQDCPKCSQNFEYQDLQSAVDHLHEYHITNCPKAAGPAGLVDDPCVGWVRETGCDIKTLPVQTDDSIAPAIRTFLDAMKGVREKTRDLHFSIRSTSKGDRNMPLLTNLVLAFEKLVGRYTLIAKEMSWINRNRAQSHQNTVDPRMIQVIGDWGAQAEQDIHELLKLAKRDIILLGSKNHNIDKLIIAPVGDGTKSRHRQILPKPNQKTRFGAVRDPKRQRFLEISALEEELEALRKVNRVQKRLFLAWERMLRPDGFQSATTEWTYVKDRQAMYPLESKLVASHETKLTDDDKSLEGLQNIARGLRHDLKQSIEILEEGHGKAIRVFTIVTLFFLPLSFVTSFFGMNTTDVRDTDWDQRMFWACALPITVGVLTLAFVYGYKWDTITEAIFRRLLLPTTRAKSPYHIFEDDLIPLTGAKNQDRPKRSRAHAESSSKTRAQLFVSKLKNKASTKSTPIQRRQTGDSLLY